MKAHPLIVLSLCSLFTPLLALAQTTATTKSPASAPPSTLYSREAAVDACTDAPRSQWLPVDEMKLLATHRGYRIKTFKVASGNCYEVYGFDRNNRIVEAYFDPVTSRLVRQNFAQ